VKNKRECAAKLSWRTSDAASASLQTHTLKKKIGQLRAVKTFKRVDTQTQLSTVISQSRFFLLAEVQQAIKIKAFFTVNIVMSAKSST
jgi:hypothetical protein